MRIESRTQARVLESLRTHHKKIEEVKQNLDTMCRENTRCGQKAVKLRRQRDQARKRGQHLEKKTGLLRDLYSGGIQFLTERVENVEKNRRLSAVNTQQWCFLREQLSRQNHSCLSYVICFQLELQMEVERLCRELRRKEVRSLDAVFDRFRNASENYLAAIDIMERDTMLRRVIQSLEAEGRRGAQLPRALAAAT